MNGSPIDRDAIRSFLLSPPGDDAARDLVEKRLMTDGEFSDDVERELDDLCDDYLDGELDGETTTKFLAAIGSSEQFRQRLEITRALRQYSRDNRTTHAEERVSTRPPIFALFDIRWVAFGAVLLAVGLGIWWLTSSRSDVDNGLAELRKAYQGQRPLEVRVSGLPDYYPYTETRGPTVLVKGLLAHDRAERYLLDSVSADPTARAHSALAQFYLTERRYDDAMREFSEAVRLSPDEAGIQSDVGAAYLEVARHGKKEGANSLELLDESLKHLDRAIVLDPRSLPPRFNRSLCLESIGLSDQAAAAWRSYIELDPNSQWANEAREHLQKHISEQPAETSGAEKEAAFLDAIKNGDEERAAAELQIGRELIRDKYLPQRLAFSFLATPDRRDELLSAMRFAGRSELKKTGDPFANEIALFYSTVSPDNYAKLLAAQTEIRAGYDQCLDQQYADALVTFRSAQQKFAALGDPAESELTKYFVAYALINTAQNEAGRLELRAISESAKRNKFLWLDAIVMHWIANSYVISREPAQARIAFERSLETAKGLGDTYTIQRNQLGLASINSVLGQNARSFEYIGSLLNGPRTIGQRQAYRTLAESARLLANGNVPNLAAAVALEAVNSADRLNDELFESQSRTYAGEAFAKAGQYGEARRWTEEARSVAAKITAEPTRNKMLALSDLKLGAIERQVKNFDAAEACYRRAADYYDNIDQPHLREEAHNGLLLTFLDSGKQAELEQQIPINIALTEEFRSRVKATDDRISYFESKVDIYDIAAQFEFDRGNREKAFNYIEMATARDLTQVVTARSGASARVGYVSRDIETIRSRMPENSQILQFSVLEDRTLAWIITREQFEVIRIDVRATVLDEMVRDLYAATSHAAGDNGDAFKRSSRAMYDLLLAPVRARLDPAKEIFIVPSKSLFNVSFAALTGPDGRPAIADLTLAYAPSANLFIDATENAKSRMSERGETLLAVGDPKFDGSKYPDLEDVPDAATEATAIGDLYKGREVLIGAAATKDAFLNKISSADVVHFAGHYMPIPGLPESSFLLFADSGAPDDGQLTNRDLSHLNLARTRLVILAACNTGSETYFSGEGLNGISRTFLSATVPLVVASQWNVDTAATARLMIAFHKFRRQEGMTSVAALRKAQLAMIADPDNRAADPYYWASFAIYGGHADY